MSSQMITPATATIPITAAAPTTAPAAKMPLTAAHPGATNARTGRSEIQVDRFMMTNLLCRARVAIGLSSKFEGHTAW